MSEERAHLYKASLFYRYTDQLPLEKPIIDRALALDPYWLYMQERKQWHTLSPYDQLVPRPPLRLPYAKEVPSLEVREQMCFVTEGNSQYFRLLIQVIESIRATQYYKDVDVFVIDDGTFSEQEKHYFYEILKVKQIACLKDHHAIDPNAPLLSSIFAGRTLMDKLFPGYRYYLYLDGDTWIHDERVIHKMLEKTMAYGITAYPSHCQCKDYPNYQDERFLTRPQIEAMRESHLVFAGLFCVDGTQHWFQTWRSLIEGIIRAGKCKFGCDEAALCYMLSHYGFSLKELLDPILDQLILWHWLPFVYEDQPHVLYTEDARTPVGVLHLSGGIARNLVEKTGSSYLPTQKIKQPLADEDRMKHSKISTKIIEDIARTDMDIYKLRVFPNQVYTSVFYRVYPWQDKASLRQEFIRLFGGEPHSLSYDGLQILG